MKFLRQLFGRGNNPNLFMAAANGELCQVLPAQNIGSAAQLQVAAGQNALLFNGDRRSTIFPAGDHLLEAQDIRHVLDGGQANILFLQITPPVKRAWQLALRPEGSEEALALSGHYTAAIDDTRLFTTALLKSGKLPDSRQVDHWLHHYIRKIFAEQRIPAADIREHTDRLSTFLHDALIPYLLDCGIRLQNFSLRLHEDSAPAAETAQPSPAAAQEPVIPALVAHQQEEIPSATHSQPESAPVATTDDADETDILIAAPQRPAAKIFYRLEKGEQVGPYSVDEINALIQEGKIRRHDLLWHQGMRNWQRAADFPTLNW
ncbi:MAG: DUF4339 domain-containing protein [Cardiobacteriaceae bacterium]|nr:DUF4339 domain-containing protein [Cardiobacteriaceae bacterium]